MRDEPKDLPCAALAEVLRRHWNMAVAAIEYAPVGAGSYHWLAEGAGGRKWFVTADALEGRRTRIRRRPDALYADLTGAYGTAAALRADGLDFVVAPVPARTGELVVRALPRWAVAVFPYVEGKPVGQGHWADPGECACAAELVGQLHAARPPASVRRWSVDIPRREGYQKAFAEIDRTWASGPYGERTRTHLASSRDRVEGWFSRYDRLAEEESNDTESWVVTHGEPHSGNFIAGSDGAFHLIDWDTVRLAPRERDLALLATDDPAVLAAYQRGAAAYVPSAAMMELYSLRWALSEICEYVTRFHAPHGDGPDDRASWEELAEYLQ